MVNKEGQLIMPIMESHDEENVSKLSGANVSNISNVY